MKRRILLVVLVVAVVGAAVGIQRLVTPVPS